jgi:hypothetical protein
MDRATRLNNGPAPEPTEWTPVNGGTADLVWRELSPSRPAVQGELPRRADAGAHIEPIA